MRGSFLEFVGGFVCLGAFVVLIGIGMCLLLGLAAQKMADSATGSGGRDARRGFEVKANTGETPVPRNED
jgi:hypothetical protein